MHDASSASIDTPPRFQRVVDFLGPDGFARLRRCTVMVVGLGGVGSHAAVMLARSGVGRLRLVDCDKITWSSLNRNAVAGPEDVGLPKPRVMKQRLSALCPDTEVEALEAFFHTDTAGELLASPLDLVIDAIDSLGPKVALLAACAARGVAVMSCMGAAGRVDASCIRVADISRTTQCHLARMVRKRLRRLGIEGGITAVYSIEAALPGLPPDAETLAATRRGRVRQTLPSLGAVPGIFGYAVASAAVERLAQGEAPAAPQNSSGALAARASVVSFS